MNPQHLIDIGLGTACAVTGWFARELWAAVKELKADLAKLREDLPRTYVARDDYRADMREIKDMLGKIFDRLDGKADKS
jgi:hypothetical protein